MNILFSSIAGHDKTESTHYLRVLQRLGHRVFWFSTPAIEDDQSHGLWAGPGFDPGIKLDTLIRLSGFAPELFIYIEPKGIIPRGLEDASFPTICILSDMHRDLNARLKIARFFDHVFIYQRNYLRYFDEHPAGHVHWQPFACDLEFFRPVEVERDLDIAFVGQLHPGSNRDRFLSMLSLRYKMNEQRYYLQREIPYIYSRSKIVVNFPLADDLNLRTFEAMSCGAMCLTQRLPNGQEFLFREGEHFVAFADEKELVDKIEYYLSHSNERQTVAAKGLEEIRQRHRLEQRIKEMFNIVQKNPDKAAPIRHMSSRQIDLHYAWLYEWWRMVEPGINLFKQARHNGRPWLFLFLHSFRSILRRLLR